MSALPVYEFPRLDVDAQIIHNYKLTCETSLRILAVEPVRYEVDPFRCPPRAYVEQAGNGQLLAILYPNRTDPNCIRHIPAAKGLMLNVFVLNDDRVVNCYWVQG
jgi:hypothetical protein